MHKVGGWLQSGQVTQSIPDHTHAREESLIEVTKCMTGYLLVQIREQGRGVYMLKHRVEEFMLKSRVEEFMLKSRAEELSSSSLAVGMLSSSESVLGSMYVESELSDRIHSSSSSSISGS